jgi:hypothetical protein
MFLLTARFLFWKTWQSMGRQMSQLLRLVVEAVGEVMAAVEEELVVL